MKSNELKQQVFAAYEAALNEIEAILTRASGHIQLFDIDLRYEPEHGDEWYELPSFVYVTKHHYYCACKVTEVSLENGSVMVTGYDQDDSICKIPVTEVEIQDVLCLLERLERREVEGTQAMLTISWQHIPLDHIGVAEMHATFKPTPGEGCRDFILTVPDLEELATYEGYRAIGACDTFAALLNRVNAAGANYLMITF